MKSAWQNVMLATGAFYLALGAGVGFAQSFSSTIEYDVGRSGQDYHSFHPRTADPALCQTSCVADAQCRAWAYSPPTLAQDHVQTCWLKNAVPAATRAVGTASGVVRPDSTGAAVAADADAKAKADAEAKAKAGQVAQAPPAVPAAPGCRTDNFSFSAVNSDAVSVKTVSSGGAPCLFKVQPQHPDQVQFTSGSIAKSPSPKSGTFTQEGEFAFKFQPAPGFTGSDQVAIKVCGHNSQRGGCATITYNVTVN
jgi:hypothetical protein